MLRRGDCGPLLREINAEWPAPGSAEADPAVPSFPDALTYLYRAAAKACLSQWAGAEADFRLIDTGKLCAHFDDGGGWNSAFRSEAECRQVRMRVYEWTSGLLKAHRADPAFVPNFPTPPTP